MNSIMNAADMQKLSLSFCGATETIQWDDDRVFKVAGKMFAASGMEADSDYSFKVDDARCRLPTLRVLCNGPTTWSSPNYRRKRESP